MLSEKQLVSFYSEMRKIACGINRRYGEDIAQDAAARVWSRRHQFSGNDTDARAWMATIVRHCAANTMRSSRCDPLHAALADDHLRIVEPPRAENIVFAKQVMGELARQKKGPMVAAAIMHANDGETAAHFGVTPNAVSNHVYRARRRLRQFAEAA